MPIYRPRMACVLWVPTVGTPQMRAEQQKGQLLYRLDLRPMSARLVSNNYDEADELELTFSHDDAGIDPRFLYDGEVHFHLGDGDDDGSFTPNGDNKRFLGMVCTVDRELGPNGALVHVRALDYTCLFLRMKNFPPDKVPHLSQTLRSAWEGICDSTGYWDIQDASRPVVVSTAKKLRKQIDFVGVDENLTLGSAVPVRIAKLGKLQPPRDADAWAVWKHAVESLGLITYIRGDRCVVTTSNAFYALADPPRFVNGKNVVELVESRDAGHLGSKGLCLRSFNPLEGRTLEAYFPPPEQRKSRKRIGASANGVGVVVDSKDFTFMESPYPCADQATLQRLCQRAWEERSRQELRGHMRVVDMFVDTVHGEAFDVLSLQAGDTISVEIDRESLGMIQRLPTLGQRKAFLLEWGYSEQMAQFIVDNLDALVRMPSRFYVRSVETTIEEPSGSDGSGTYETRIEFLNRLELDGSALSKATSAAQPPMRDQSDAVPSGERRRNDRVSEEEDRS